MSWKKNAYGGTNGIEHREDPVDSTTPDTMEYPGWKPLVYVRPGTVGTGELLSHQALMDNEAAGRGWDQAQPDPGYATRVIDRGETWHGVEQECEVPYVHKNDEANLPRHDYVEQVYPEKDHLDDLPPVRVEVVNRNPIERTEMVILSFAITSPSPSAQGSNSQNGLTAIKVLGRDPHRVRAMIGTVGAVTGTPVILNGPMATAANGFPIPAATVQALPLTTDQDVWVSGSASTDAATIVVLVERRVNDDPQHQL